MIILYDFIILPVMTMFIIPVLLQLICLSGTIVAVKLFRGKITMLDFGSGKKIFKLKNFQININLIGGYSWQMTGVKRNNRFANIIIHLAGGLTNLLLGLALWNLQAIGYIEISLNLVLLIGFNFIHALRCLFPYTFDNHNSAGMRIWQYIRYGYSESSTEFNKNMKQYVLTMKAWDLINEEKYNEALSIVNSILNIKQQFPYALHCRGRINSKLNRYEEALQDYWDYLHYKPNSDNIYVNIAHIYNTQGDLEKYFKFNIEAININPKNTYALNNIADYYITTGNYGEAIKYAEMGIKINSKYNTIYCTLAEAHLFLNDMDKFYKNIKLAFKYGYTTKRVYENDNLKDILMDSQFRAIINTVAN